MRVRAELMDESLEMLQYLWRDEPFEFAGKHYRSKKIAELMPPAPPPGAAAADPDLGGRRLAAGEVDAGPRCRTAGCRATSFRR